jgi:hypothetical protein
MHIRDAFNMCEVFRGSGTAGPPTPTAPRKGTRGSASSTTCSSAMEEGGTHLNHGKDNFRYGSGQMCRKKSIKVFAANYVFAKRRLDISDLVARVSLQSGIFIRFSLSRLSLTSQFPHQSSREHLLRVMTNVLR